MEDRTWRQLLTILNTHCSSLAAEIEEALGVERQPSSEQGKHRYRSPPCIVMSAATLSTASTIALQQYMYMYKYIINHIHLEITAWTHSIIIQSMNTVGSTAATLIGNARTCR